MHTKSGLIIGAAFLGFSAIRLIAILMYGANLYTLSMFCIELAVGLWILLQWPSFPSWVKSGIVFVGFSYILPFLMMPLYHHATVAPPETANPFVVEVINWETELSAFFFSNPLVHHRYELLATAEGAGFHVTHSKALANRILDLTWTAFLGGFLFLVVVFLDRKGRSTGTSVKCRRASLLNIVRLFLFAFCAFAFGGMIVPLTSGKVSLCRGPIQTYCRYDVTENPAFFWIGAGVYILICGLLVYAFVRSLQEK